MGIRTETGEVSLMTRKKGIKTTPQPTVTDTRFFAVQCIGEGHTLIVTNDVIVGVTPRFQQFRGMPLKALEDHCKVSGLELKEMPQ